MDQPHSSRLFPEPDEDRNDLKVRLNNPVIATITPEELDAYRRLSVELDALQHGNASFEKAVEVYSRRLQFWNHMWNKYELIPNYEYNINPHNGHLYGVPMPQVLWEVWGDE